MRGKKIPVRKINGRLIPVMDNEIADFPRERWKSIPDFADYQISSHGRIKSLARYTYDKNGVEYFRQEKMLRLSLTHRGKHVLIQTVLIKDGLRYTFSVSRLVHHIFVAPFDLSDHTVIVVKKDEDQLNCHYKNLKLISVSENITDGFSKGRKSGFDKKRCLIHQYDMNGVLAGSYCSISEAAKAMKVSVTSLRIASKKKYIVCKGSFWRLGRVYPRIDVTKLKAKRNDTFSSIKIPVQKLSLTGVPLEIYDSIRSAAKAVGADSSALAKTCKNPKLICKGHHWRYVTTGKPIRKEKRVRQLTMDMNQMKVYDSITQAATAVNVHASVITMACTLEHYTCRGYKWRFVD